MILYPSLPLPFSPLYILFSLWADTYSTMYLCNELSKALQDETAYENEENNLAHYCP